MLWRRPNRENDLERELRAHLDLEAEETGDRHAARRAFGNLTVVKETIHEMSHWTAVEQLSQDLRYGMRLLLHSPAFSIVAVLTLALGIGANTAIFSVVNAVLLRPLPFPEPDRLVRIWEASPVGSDRNVVDPYNFLTWRERTRSFEQMAAIDSWTSNITGQRQAPRRAWLARLVRVLLHPQSHTVHWAAPSLAKKTPGPRHQRAFQLRLLAEPLRQRPDHPGTEHHRERRHRHRRWHPAARFSLSRLEGGRICALCHRPRRGPQRRPLAFHHRPLEAGCQPRAGPTGRRRSRAATLHRTARHG